MNASLESLKQYCNSLVQYSRRKTVEVRIGDVPMGGDNPIRIQSMTTIDTMDTKGSVEQTIRMVEAGCEYVRITAARIVEKVRINPGNYADKKRFENIDYTDAAYDAELDRIRAKFTPLVKICKEYGTAMRIGTNHGSLSDRIMSRYGDSPLGMVESALEFLRICEDLNYYDIVLSMKSSNPQVMVQAYRLLVQKLGGPSVRPYQPAGYYAHLNFPKREYKADTDALGLGRPDAEPLASETIEPIVEFSSRLMLMNMNRTFARSSTSATMPVAMM